jgi:hypothetical protein
MSFLIFFVLIMSVPSSFAQEAKNPSLQITTIDVPFFEFNTIARESTIIELNEIHPISWQITVDNNLIYSRPDGSAVMRFYDNVEQEKFIEMGMGSPPDEKFWLAVQLPNQEGYVVVHSTLERGWIPTSKLILAYTDRAGLTVQNGERIVVSNLDIGVFAVDSYSVHGLEGSTEPPVTHSGSITVEFLSGDPSQNAFALFPFIVTAIVGALAGGLYITKKRSTPTQTNSDSS